MLSALFIGLALTEVIELLCALIFGLRKRELLVIVLVNMLTNPPAQAVFWLLAWIFPAVPAIIIQIPLEIAVIIAEASIYRSLLDFSRPLLFSAVANALSWGIGLIIQALV